MIKEELNEYKSTFTFMHDSTPDPSQRYDQDDQHRYLIVKQEPKLYPD